MTTLQSLPLFPLNTVLFPGTTLPLHIFEPRYQLMIKRCWKLSKPFGVVLIREGREVGGDAVPYDVGTSATIIHIQPLDRGRMNIQAVGSTRFRIQDIEQRQPFLVARVSDYPLRGQRAPEIRPLADALRTGLRHYISRLRSVTEQSLPTEMPEDNQALAYLAATTLPLPIQERQRLLAVEDLAALLKMEQMLLRREQMLLEHMIQHHAQVIRTGLPFSLN